MPSVPSPRPETLAVRLLPRSGFLLTGACLLGIAGCIETADPSSADEGGWAGVVVERSGALPAPDAARYPATTAPDGLDLRETLDRPVNLLFVGFTNCPDICPVHLANLGAVMRELPLEVEREIAVAFISADPARDSLPRIEEWLGALHEDFVGFRPTRAEVNRLEDALALPRSVVDPEDPEGNYLVAHAGQILALDSAGRVRLAYPWGIRQRDWKRDLPRLVRGEWPDPVSMEAAIDTGSVR